MRQSPTVLHGIKDQRVDRRGSQRRGVVQVADDLAPEHPEVVHVLANGLVGEVAFAEVLEERPEARDEFLAGRNIFRESHPALRPLVEILAARHGIDGAGGLRLGHGLRYGTTFRLSDAARHGTDDDSKSVLSVSGIRL